MGTPKTAAERIDRHAEIQALIARIDGSALPSETRKAFLSIHAWFGRAGDVSDKQLNWLRAMARIWPKLKTTPRKDSSDRRFGTLAVASSSLIPHFNPIRFPEHQARRILGLCLSIRTSSSPTSPPPGC
jgi:hypothetical protein